MTQSGDNIHELHHRLPAMGYKDTALITKEMLESITEIRSIPISNMLEDPITDKKYVPEALLGVVFAIVSDDDTVPDDIIAVKNDVIKKFNRALKPQL